MTSDQALELAQQLYRAGRFAISDHARDQMRDRNVKPQDLRNAILNAHGCQAGYSGRWLVEGQDQDGESLTVVVTILDSLLIITVRE